MEEWRDIPYWPYRISDHGQVMSIEKTVRGRFGPYKKKAMILKPKLTEFGYLTVVLQKNKVKRYVFIHVLVAEAFIGPRIKGIQVDHINCLKIDNRVCNLEYVSASENSRRAHANGLCPPPSGEIHGGSKLTEIEVTEIRKILIEKTETGAQLSRRFGVSQATISMIKDRKIWDHI